MVGTLGRDRQDKERVLGSGSRGTMLSLVVVVVDRVAQLAGAQADDAEGQFT